ncbi:MAG TPA: AIM24 family protein [Anaerolineae bacterium]|nr:AIM24 family protein [Anaerolineae bacterium]
MSKNTVAAFLEKTAQDDDAHEKFQLESPYMLEINLEGQIWSKMGAMVGYTGDVKFTREGILEHGVGRMLKKMVTGEGLPLMKMEGQGRIYLADKGKKVQILALGEGETIYVNGNDLLAFEKQVEWDIKMARKIAGAVSGGLFNVRLTGPGMIAMTTHYDPMTLRVKPGSPVFTDPNATVAWSGSLTPDFKTDISFKTLLGRGSGESFQMKFEGDGWVVLQPFEEVPIITTG